MKYLMMILVFAVGISCNSTKKTADAEAEGARFVVSFFSPGNGIDRKALARFNDFLKANYPELEANRVQWGREGEIDYCFALAKMKKEEQVIFIKKAKAAIGDTSRVNYYENKACRKPRDS